MLFSSRIWERQDDQTYEKLCGQNGLRGISRQSFFTVADLKDVALETTLRYTNDI